MGPLRGMSLSIVLLLCLLVTASPLRGAERALDTSERFPATAGKRLVIDAGTVDVQVRAGDVAGFVVETRLHIAGVGQHKAESWISAHTPATTDGEDALRITVPSDGAGFLGLGYLTARAHLGVLAPAQAIPDVTTTTGSIVVRGDFPSAEPLMLRTAGGAMSLEGACPAVDVRSTGGDATLHVVRPLARLVARTSSGSVTLVGGARHVEIDTASGHVELANLSGAADVQTTTGRITLSWDRLDPGDQVTVRSSSGPVELALPPGVGARGTLTTTTGTIRCALPGTLSEDTHTVTLAGDGPTVLVETASGDIVLRARSDLVE